MAEVEAATCQVTLAALPSAQCVPCSGSLADLPCIIAGLMPYAHDLWLRKKRHPNITGGNRLDPRDQAGAALISRRFRASFPLTTLIR